MRGGRKFLCCMSRTCSSYDSRTYILYCRADLNATLFHVIVLTKLCRREVRAVVRALLDPVIARWGHMACIFMNLRGSIWTNRTMITFFSTGHHYLQLYPVLMDAHVGGFEIMTSVNAPCRAMFHEFPWCQSELA